MLKRLTRSAKPAERKTSSLAELIALHGAGEAPIRLPQPGYTTNVVAYRCIRMIAEAAASVPLRAIEGGAELVDGDLCRIMDQPNPDQSGKVFLEEIYGYLQTHGNAYVERLDDGMATRALFLLHPDSVEQRNGSFSIRTVRGSRVVSSDEYGRSPILHLALWQPSTTQQGHAPLKSAGEAIHLHNAASAWNRQLLENAARPSGALIHRGPSGDEHLTPEQFDRLRSELDEGFSGMKSAGRPLLLDGGLDWRPMGLTPAEMDFQNLKNSAARDIALAFGVPPMLLGIPGDNTYSNYKEANLAFWRQTILPLVMKAAEALSGWLDPSRLCKIEADVTGLEALAPERSSRLDRIATADFLTDQEKRKALGFTPFPEGS